MKVLNAVGGRTLTKTASLILGKVGTNKLWSMYSVLGSGGKKEALFQLAQIKALFMGTFQNFSFFSTSQH